MADNNIQIITNIICRSLFEPDVMSELPAFRAGSFYTSRELASADNCQLCQVNLYSVSVDQV